MKFSASRFFFKRVEGDILGTEIIVSYDKLMIVFTWLSTFHYMNWVLVKAVCLLLLKIKPDSDSEYGMPKEVFKYFFLGRSTCYQLHTKYRLPELLNWKLHNFVQRWSCQPCSSPLLIEEFCVWMYILILECSGRKHELSIISREGEVMVWG